MKIIHGNSQELSGFMECNKSDVLSYLNESGAILFRGFESNIELDEVARKMDFLPVDTYIPGIAPRKEFKKGNSFVFTSTEAPPHLPILPHNEMTYWPQAPDLIMFHCKMIESAPGSGSGETVIYDTSKAAAALEPALLKKLALGSVFQRFYPGRFNPQWDIADSVAGGSCWQNAFATTNALEVESICKKNGVSFEWQHSSGNPPSLITRVLLPWYANGCLALQTPLLGKQVYHDLIRRFPSRFDNPKLRQSISSESVAPKVDLLKPDDEAEDPFLEKGEISDLMEAIWNEAVFVEWEEGDVLVIDNKTMAHARMNVVGRRKIVAVMAKRTTVDV